MVTKINIKLHDKFKYYPDVVQKIREAEKRINFELQHNDFWSRVRQVTYLKKNQFSQTDDTVEQVIERLKSGAEAKDPLVDYEWDIEIEPYWSRKRVLGYTYSSLAYKIYANMRYYTRDSFSVGSIAGNITHEYCHKVGYGHDYRSTYRRQYSVPYQIGYIMRDCINSRTNQFELAELYHFEHPSFFKKSQIKLGFIS